MSITIISNSSTVHTITQPKKNHCLVKTIQWIRQKEETNPLGICLLKTLAIFALFISILGIPIFFALRKEYILQSNQKNHSQVSTLSASTLQKTTAYKPQETYQTSSGQAIHKREFSHLKETLFVLHRQKLEKEKELEKLMQQESELPDVKTFRKERDSVGSSLTDKQTALEKAQISTLGLRNQNKIHLERLKRAKTKLLFYAAQEERKEQERSSIEHRQKSLPLEIAANVKRIQVLTSLYQQNVKELEALKVQLKN